MTKFLCTADLHIGRKCSGFEEESPLKTFDGLVDVAIADGADAMLIAGDLFEDTSAQYATRGGVKRILERMKKENIPVLAVSGNHDWEALAIFNKLNPGLIDVFSSEHWEAKTVAGIQIVGRSFSRERSGSLMNDYPGFGPQLTIGLVHADIDVQNSPYNPTPVASLTGRGVSAWLVGHIHVPRHWPEAKVSYPGSLQALDPAEQGVHGFRWLEITGNHVQFSDVVPLSTVRYETVELTIRPGELIDDLVKQWAGSKRIAREQLHIRVRLKHMNRALLGLSQVLVDCDSDRYEIIDCYEGMDENIDLVAEATATDARGQAARLLLGLDGIGDDAWIENARHMVATVESEMQSARGQIGVLDGEAFRILTEVPDEEARNAVRSALEGVMATPLGGSR